MMDSKTISFAKGKQEYVINIEGIDLHFTFDYKEGSHNLILFIHGLGCSSDSFFKVFEKDYFPNASILIPDLPGFGSSGKPGKFSYKMEDDANVLEKLLVNFPHYHIHIAAHSMGAAVGLLFSHELFRRVKSFINIEGNLIADDCGIFSRGIVSASLEEFSNSIFDEYKTHFSFSNMLRFDETTPEVLYKSAVSLVKWSDSGKLLEKFKCLNANKAYIYGEQNRHMKVLEYLHDIDTIMISNSGHEVMTDNPEEFFGILNSFVEV